MGATPGSGIGMPADPATDAGSNLVFICAVLLEIHKSLPPKLHWICSLLFQFYVLQNHFKIQKATMRDKFICKGCSSTLGFATSFDVDEVVGIFYNSLKSMKRTILRSDKLSDE